MVDVLRLPDGRDHARLDSERSYLPSRRSSISSRAESDISVFSDTSISSSQSSLSLHSSTGWDSSSTYDSDEDDNLRRLNSISDVTELAPLYQPLHCQSPTEQLSNADFKLATCHPLSEPVSHTKAGPSVRCPVQRVVCHDEQPQRGGVRRVSTAPTSSQRDVCLQQQDGDFLKPLPPSHSLQGSNCSGDRSCHPRRTATGSSWTKPSLVTQDERRVNFVENLVDTATDLVSLIWPLSVHPAYPDVQHRSGSPVISLRFFIRETLRRSRTSFSTLQVAMYYLALVNFFGKLPHCDFTREQQTDSVSGRALQCGRRTFLSSLILASKYLQDKNYYTKAWSRISNLSVAEINSNEVALLAALEYKLHIKPTDFQKWTECISKCTSAKQRGFECPWVEGLMSMNMWRTSVDEFGIPLLSSKFEQPKDLHNHELLASVDPNDSVSCPAEAFSHRQNLTQATCSVNPTRSCLRNQFPAPSVSESRQWLGMASHLGMAQRPGPLRLAGANSLSARRESLQNSGRSLIPSNPAPLPPSPPKTPSPTHQNLKTQDSIREEEPTPMAGQAPPPAPREPLISLNPSPESKDGSNTFGAYLSPVSSNGSGPQLSSLESVPVLRKGLGIQDFSATEGLEVIPDDDCAVENHKLENETKRLTRLGVIPISNNSVNPAEDDMNSKPLSGPSGVSWSSVSGKRSKDKRCEHRTQKESARSTSSCFSRRKRGATSFSGELPLRTGKAMKV